MIHKAWSTIEGLTIFFQGYPLNFKVTRGKKIAHFGPNWAFPDCNFSLNSLMALKCCTKLNVTKKRIPMVCQGNPMNLKVTRGKTSLFWPELNVSGQQLQFEFTEGFDIMHKAWCNVEEVSYNFSRSSIKFQGHMAEKSMFWIQFE